MPKKKKITVRRKIEDLHQDELWALRQEIVLNSLFLTDYRNSFGFAPFSVRAFFDGYYEYLEGLVKESGYKVVTPELINRFDCSDHLFDYYWCNQDYSWFEYEPEWTPEEEQAYCNYWNGIAK